MKQSYITDDMVQITLADLLEGETAYAVPWAMWADSEGALWLDENFTLHHSAGGTVHMKVTKKDGNYQVSKRSLKDYRFMRGQTPIVLNAPGNALPVKLVR